MKRKVNLRVPALLAALFCSVTFAACANQGGSGTTAAEDTQQPVVVNTPQADAAADNATVATEAAAPVTAADASEYPLYTDTPKSLAPVQCGSCHEGEYKRLQASKSKHRFECTDCHEQLHAYVPTKKNYQEILPKCSNCHDLPHGEAFTKCLGCHQDPHTPLTIPFSGVSQEIKNKAGKKVVACEVCHYNPEGKEFETHPCKHNTEVGCTGCHADKHGVRPTCFDCHEPHVEGQVYKDCLVCHSPHSAKNIKKYPEDTNNNICGSCHTSEYQHLQTNKTKHSALYCATCHVKHGQIPKCRNCHGEPHGAALHKRFPRCLECHIDPHNLPVVNPKK
ncbi:MAG TPA: cytochrome C [Desulfobulbus sp.]|nr:cytochrome C [Desulfobulbus sp.]